VTSMVLHHRCASGIDLHPRYSSCGGDYFCHILLLIELIEAVDRGVNDEIRPRDLDGNRCGFRS
jgi:hypothetical protein